MTAGQTPFAGLPRAAIEHLSKEWDDGGLWEDVLWLTGRFVDAADVDKPIAWHHLLLAVGNFKREPGRRIRPTRLAEVTEQRSEIPGPAKLQVPDGNLILERDSASSWRALAARTRGMGVSTASAVLSALWPSAHVIIDRRALGAAYGLAGAPGWSGAPNWESKVPVTVSWTAYDWYRPWVLDVAMTTRTEPVMVERALYKLDQRLPGGK